jgi:hypothetical protein
MMDRVLALALLAALVLSGASAVSATIGNRRAVERQPPAGGHRTGVVRIQGNSLADDQGVWFAEGVTLMPAMALVQRFQKLADANCALGAQGINVARFLAVVGGTEFPTDRGGHGDPWARLAIDPRDPGWPVQLARTTDYFYDKCGIRSAWTIFGGTAHVPTLADQQRVVQSWLEVMRPRLHKVGWVEVANEMALNGFEGPQGIQRARTLACDLKRGLPPDFPIAMSAAMGPDSERDAEMRAMFEGSCANLYTPHFSRTVDGAEGPWRAVRDPWAWRPIWSLRAAVDNERIGPGSSVASERDTARIVAGWITTKLAGLTGYHLHTGAGVWAGQIDPAFVNGGVDGLRGVFATIAEEPGAAAALATMQKFRAILPADLHTWRRVSHDASDHPFGASFQRTGQTFSQIWPDGRTPHGVVRAFCAVRQPRFVCLLAGIRDRIDLKWSAPLTATAYSAKTGEPIATNQPDERAGTLRQAVDTDMVLVGKFQ